jgi:hypothetical protein
MPVGDYSFCVEQASRQFEVTAWGAHRDRESFSLSSRQQADLHRFFGCQQVVALQPPSG